MSNAERNLLAARNARDGAREALDRRILRVKTDVSARGIGGRIVDRAGEELSDAVSIAINVAKESKVVIAGIAAALTLWLFRQPIIDWVKQRFDPDVKE